MENQLDQLSPTQRALLQIRELRAQLDVYQRRQSEPIAIVGMGCRFPGNADTPAAFWDVLRDGVDAISEVPADRFDIDRYYDANPDAAGQDLDALGRVPVAGRSLRCRSSSASRRAKRPRMDPQQRLLLEVTWEALEHAGYAPDRLFGSQTGVFLGIGSYDYMQMQLQRSKPELHRRLSRPRASATAWRRAGSRTCSACTGRACRSTPPAPRRWSPCISPARACGSGECDLALAGGVNLILSPELHINFSRAQHDGRRRPLQDVRRRGRWLRARRRLRHHRAASG